jgi:hypothetical protein
MIHIKLRTVRKQWGMKMAKEVSMEEYKSEWL